MLDGYRAFLKDKYKSENTRNSYLQAVGEYLKWYEETYGQPMSQLFRANVLDYISFLRTIKKLSNRSVNTKLSALRSFNGYLIQAGIQNENIMSDVDYLLIQNVYCNPSTVDQVQVEAFRQRVLERCGKRDYAIVTILAYAGLRITECLSLCLEDVNLTAREITVRQGKGDKQRVVYFGGKIVNAVREYLKERPETDCPYLFISKKGGRLDRSQLNRVFNAHSDDITPHILRHFYCSRAIEMGYSISEVANQAGHANVHTTLLYTNPTREQMKGKANLL